MFFPVETTQEVWQWFNIMEDDIKKDIQRIIIGAALMPFLGGVRTDCP